MDMKESFNYLDFFERDEFLDSSSISEADQSSVFEDLRRDLVVNTDTGERVETALNEEISKDEDYSVNSSNYIPDDLASVFLDWLQSNKEIMSAEDLRRVKIKKSTIASAARQLGGGKEGTKKLLKLVLNWVQTNQLQRQRSIPTTSPTISHFGSPSFETTPNPSNNNNHDPVSNSNHFVYSTPYSHPVAILTPPPPPPQHHPFSTGSDHPPNNGGFYDFGSGQYKPFNNGQYDYTDIGVSGGHGGEAEHFMSLGSLATKEARKKRMTRQRRLISNNRHQNNPVSDSRKMSSKGTSYGRSNSFSASAASHPPLPRLPQPLRRAGLAIPNFY